MTKQCLAFQCPNWAEPGESFCDAHASRIARRITSPADLTPTQRLILREMADCNDEWRPYLRTFARDIDLPVETVRRELRPMIEAQLVTYGPVSDIDTGAPTGSSYWLTQTGMALRDAIAKEKA